MTRPSEQHYREMTKKLTSITGQYRMFDVFRDFVHMFALAIRNSVDKRDWQEREDRYLEVAGKYTRDQLDTMAEVFALVVTQMEIEPQDVLGKLYMELEISNEAGGQFFTPYDLAKLMAAMQADQIADSSTESYVSIYEPACGAGAFMIAIAQELRQRDREFHVTAEDIDTVAVHMAYIQFTLLDIPAIVHHRNTLTLETFDTWATPAHVLGLWTYRLTRGPSNVEPVEPATAPEPIDLTEATQGAFDFVLEGV